VEGMGEQSRIDTINIPHNLLVSERGGIDSTVVKQSHFREPIEKSPGSLRGSSRIWGDISEESQRMVVGALLDEAQSARLDLGETALLLAVARVESGFNPDAASTRSSAAGIGQFIDATREAYGIGYVKRFDLRSNARAMINYLKSNMELAQKRFGAAAQRDRLAYAYALYHDGPSLKSGGMEIAGKVVMPWVDKFQSWLK
jgi:putative chitinase